jgi:hypothetical protein
MRTACLAGPRHRDERAQRLVGGDAARARRRSRAFRPPRGPAATSSWRFLLGLGHRPGQRGQKLVAKLQHLRFRWGEGDEPLEQIVEPVARVRLLALSLLALDAARQPATVCPRSSSAFASTQTTRRSPFGRRAERPGRGCGARRAACRSPTAPRRRSSRSSPRPPPARSQERRTARRDPPKPPRASERSSQPRAFFLSMWLRQSAWLRSRPSAHQRLCTVQRLPFGGTATSSALCPGALPR